MAGGDNSGSLFRIGDNVELSRVLGHISVLVVFVIVLEQGLHRLGHHVKRYPKYNEMMSKIYGELMILGLIGLGIKIAKEVAHLDPYSKNMIAVQAADILVFVLALLLILQAISIFLQLRYKNIQIDKAELLSSSRLLEEFERHQRAAGRFSQVVAMCARWFVPAKYRKRCRPVQSSDFEDLAKTRVLRHFFLKMHGLPGPFPFAKYLRQAQENQINHMIEVDISTWVVLLLFGWGLAEATELMEGHGGNPEAEFAVVASLFGLMWFTVALHIVIYCYFTWAIKTLLDAAVGSDWKKEKGSLIKKLHEISRYEEQLPYLAQNAAALDAIASMERVREEKEIQNAQHRPRCHDTGFQVIEALVRRFLRACWPPRQRLPIDSSTPDFGAYTTTRQNVQVHWFSPKPWQFIVMTSLMLNAFCFALFCQCALYQMAELYNKYGFISIVNVPIPFLVNMIILQPHIIRQFILVSSICHIDGDALGEIIDHFTETVRLRAEFKLRVLEHLSHTGATLKVIETAFERQDPHKTGFLEIDQVRLVLGQYGFKLSYFRFSSVTKLLFQLHGTKIKYTDVLNQLSQQEDVRSLYGGSMVLISSEGTLERMSFAPLQSHDAQFVPSPRRTWGVVDTRRSASDQENVIERMVL
ncbi:hypothetical protein Poli38472_000988 [Pythium oligandrum]|uniref:EF-hand domain-containing protein n=1 Tax=Pythium oligandrum TaxID=41045 RepID=A0A8K1FFV1_PYTOL|nr:hypothetical protein Poli38472_000988 [Pythium oligandrum]|eukprot:TMW60946.1 hypothetical protein Poli38472_000988 [Pythium oligandrum]